MRPQKEIGMEILKARTVEIGVDIGGTKTHLRATDPGGATRDMIIPTADWRVRDWDKDAIALSEIARNFARGAAIAQMAVGAHGCDDQQECEAFHAAFGRHAGFPVAVVNDAELMPAALGLEGQIGLVSGTGSIAVCRNRDGRMLVAGGWGWMIGDEGSASGLMREAARKVAYYLDGGGSESEPLVSRVFAALEISSVARIGTGVAATGGAAGLGRHAHIIFEAVEAGSVLARQVIEDGARDLAGLIGLLRKNGAEATAVVAGGSVIASQPLLWSAFSAQVDRLYGGNVSAQLFQGAPVEGACRIAARLARPVTPRTKFSTY